MVIDSIFENDIFPDLKEYVTTNSIYSPKVTKKQALDSNTFPIVTVKLLPVTNKYNNLTYGEETYTFGIDINIYAQEKTINTTKYAKKTVCDEVTNKIVEYFKNNFHVTIKVEYDILNIDSNVHRNNVKISGKLDTKYGQNNLVIYPN